ncbi:MAG: hypothetical protein GYA63_02275 [Armatimonadetes bacterium]|jgi:hypothetical protein|nr:hypothetical protein [Armatimonadota bacterium]
MADGKTITAVLRDDHTLVLDEPLAIESGTVEIVIRPQRKETQGSILASLREIRAGQKRRGHVPMTRDEVDDYIKEERRGWGV